MTQPQWIYFFGSGQADGGNEVKHLVGGKGASLAEMTRAGLNVPPGFTISTEACQRYFERNQRWPDDLLDDVRSAMNRLEKTTQRCFGKGDHPLLVAVRSGAAQSMPGMMDTLLNVGTWETLIESIEAVFRSWNSERAVTYRKHHGIDHLLGTAVNVQVMCPSEISGVMFTTNPVQTGLDEIIIESALGLGEAIVLGQVTPDRFVLDKKNLTIREKIAGPGQGTFSLSDDRVLQLARLGLKVESYFETPCDIEWGWADSQFYLLQSRPIRHKRSSIDDAEREAVRQEEIDTLKAMADPRGTVWARFNLSEILPEPTPMTWAIVRRFMSGAGGFGQMYRDLGFDPDPALDEIGIFDLVCGRTYCNLSREPRMQYRSMPFEHSFERLKENPSLAFYPQATPNFKQAGWRFWLTLPVTFFKMLWSNRKLKRMERTFAQRFTNEIVPRYLDEVKRAELEDVSALETSVLLERIETWIRKTLYDFGRESLKPTALAAVSMANLERTLTRRLTRFSSDVQKQQEYETRGMERAKAFVRELVMGVHPDADSDLPGALRLLAAGKLSKQKFLEDFGHRGSMEMELSRPRWREQSDRLSRSSTPTTGHEEPGKQEAVWDTLALEAHLLSFQRRILEEEVSVLHSYLKLRETAKHHLMRGYDLIRRYLVELDRRFNLDGGIFFLLPDELPSLITLNLKDDARRTVFLTRIEQRRKRREIALSLPVPQVIFSDDLDAVGRVEEVDAAASMQGVPLSAGVAEGSAWVLHEVEDGLPPSDDYILVCPTTDPAWVPLFVNARGLVMETGGVLSHGAIVAREFGLPAVAGISDVHRRLKTGQRLRVDGGTGKVSLLD